MSVMRRWRARFAWYDLWIGVFIDRRKRVVYVCPLPTLLLEWRWGTPEPEQPRGAVGTTLRQTRRALAELRDGRTDDALYTLTFLADWLAGLAEERGRP
jgi:hypothetical protein